MKRKDMSKRVIFLSCILQLLVICSSCQSHGIDFDCKNLQGLCPEKESHMSCLVSSSYYYHSIRINNDSCLRSKGIEVSFSNLRECRDQPFEHIVTPGCGKFNGSCMIKDSVRRLDLVFTATVNLHGANATCIAQDSDDNAIAQHCIIKLGEVPRPPQNLYFNSSAVSWSEPLKSKGRADQQLQYHVVVNSSSSNNNNETFVNQTSYWLGVKDANASYISVCVSTQNCIGRSTPSCIEINQSFNDLIPPVPAITAVKIIDNNVTLFWELNSTNLSNICYDIEMDSRIEYRCISECSFALLNVEKINNKTTIHIRIRANNISGKIAGEWTHLFCVTVYPLFPHILQKLQPELNSTDQGMNNLTLMIRLQKKLVVDVNVCQPQNTNVFIIEKPIEEDLEYTFNVTIRYGKDQKLKVNLQSDLFALSFQGIFYATPDQKITCSDCQLCTKSNMFLICFSLILLLVNTYCIW